MSPFETFRRTLGDGELFPGGLFSRNFSRRMFSLICRISLHFYGFLLINRQPRTSQIKSQVASTLT